MDYFEYKVIPAPRRGARIKGLKGPAGRFAGALETTINELAVTGWEYIRAESLPADERQGITMRKTETYQNVLIFRRPADPSSTEELVTALLEDQTDADDESDAEQNLFEDTSNDFFDDIEDAESVENEDTSEADTDENTETENEQRG